MMIDNSTLWQLKKQGKLNSAAPVASVTFNLGIKKHEDVYVWKVSTHDIFVRKLYGIASYGFH